jgi:hypothetical protein
VVFLFRADASAWLKGELRPTRRPSTDHARRGRSAARPASPARPRARPISAASAASRQRSRGRARRAGAAGADHRLHARAELVARVLPRPPDSAADDRQCSGRSGRFGFVVHGLWPEGRGATGRSGARRAALTRASSPATCA